MNVIEHVVTEIKEGPVYCGGHWHVKVMADAWGHVAEITLTYRKKEHAEKVKVGFRFKG